MPMGHVRLSAADGTPPSPRIIANRTTFVNSTIASVRTTNASCHPPPSPPLPTRRRCAGGASSWVRPRGARSTPSPCGACMPAGVGAAGAAAAGAAAAARAREGERGEGDDQCVVKVRVGVEVVCQVEIELHDHTVCRSSSVKISVYTNSLRCAVGMLMNTAVPGSACTSVKIGSTEKLHAPLPVTLRT